MKDVKSMKRPARMEHLESLIGFVAACAREHGVPPKIVSKIELAAEEALVNIIRYAYPDKPGEVEVTCHKDENAFTVIFRDWGIPFDPVTRPDPNTHLSLAERRIGGMGILLIKRMIPEVRYERKDQANVLYFIIPEER